MTIPTRYLRLLAVAGIAIIVIVGLAVALLAFQANAAVERIAATLKPGFELTYSAPRVGLDGDLSVRNFRLRPTGEGMATLVADRAVLRTPGATWFLRTAFGSGPVLPPIDRVGLSLEGVSVEGGGELHPALRWIGARSAAPFEAAGCGTAIRFGADDWQQIGLRTEPGSLEADYAVTGPGLGTVTAAYAIPGSSRVEHRRVLKLPDPRQPLAEKAADTATVESQWRILDDGFVAARNRMCGRRAQVARNLFADQHVAAVQAWVRRLGLVPSAELVDTYRRYALRGGELRFESRPRSPIGFASYAAADPAERVRALGATLQASGKAPARFELSELATTGVVAPEPVAGVDGAPAVAPEDPAADPAAAPGASSVATRDAAATAPSAALPVAPTDPLPPEPTVATSPPGRPAATPPVTAPDPPPPASVPASPPPAAAPAPTTPAPSAPAAPVASTTPTPRDASAPAPPETTTPARAADAIASTTPVPPPVATPPAPKPTPAAPQPRTTATAKPAPPKAAPVRRGVAEYETLERAVGMRLAVRTVHETRRVGVLREWTGAALTLELSGRDGGMDLKIPKGDIVAAEILDTNAVPPRAHAEKN